MSKRLTRKKSGLLSELPPRQRKYCEKALEAGLERSIKQNAIEAGIPERTAYRWHSSDTRFRDVWARLIDEQVHRYGPGVMSAVAQKAVNGDTRAARLFLDVAGRTQRTSVNVGVQVNQADVERRQRDTIELARRLVFLYNRWLEDGIEIPDPLKRLAARAQADAERRRAEAERLVTEEREVIEQKQALPPQEPEGRIIEGEVDYEEVLRRIEVKEKSKTERDERGLELGTDYREMALPMAVNPRVVTMRNRKKR